MLDADVKERVCDLAWELGYDCDDEKVEGLFKSFIDQIGRASCRERV